MPDTQQSVPGSDTFLRPEAVLIQLPINEGFKVADFGAGSGYFSVLFAQRVGSEGKVFAIDVVSEALEAIRSRARLAGVANIEAKRANLEVPGSTGLNDASLDLVFIANVLFQSQKKEAILKEAVRVLKSGGFLVVIGWHKEQPFVSKEGLWPLSESEARQLAEKLDLKFEKKLDVGAYHWGSIFKK